MSLHRRQFVQAAIACTATLGTGRRLRAQPPPVEKSPPEPQVLLTWGTNGHENGQFDVPIAICVAPHDEILVTDFRQTNADAQARLQRFDTEGRFLGSFELEPMPGGLALDQDGLLYATHMMLHKVTVHDRAGKVLREFGQKGTEPGQFDQPGGIVVGADGTIYVADQVNRRVQRLTPDGKPLAAWGKYGVAPGEFGGNCSPNSRVGGPHFLAFDSQGNLYTTEGSVGRIQKFTSDGTFLLAWGDNEVGPGHFGGGHALKGPIAIAINSQDQVCVTATNHFVQQFTTSGHYVHRIGGEGNEPGQFNLPHGLAFDRHGHLYVCDARNSRIQKLAL